MHVALAREWYCCRLCSIVAVIGIVMRRNDCSNAAAMRLHRLQSDLRAPNSMQVKLTELIVLDDPVPPKEHLTAASPSQIAARSAEQAQEA